MIFGDLRLKLAKNRVRTRNRQITDNQIPKSRYLYMYVCINTITWQKLQRITKKMENTQFIHVLYMYYTCIIQVAMCKYFHVVNYQSQVVDK